MGNRRKAYLTGSRPTLRSPFTEGAPTPPREPVRLYDTSGPGSDPHLGLPPLRGPWVHERGDVEHYVGRTAALRDEGRASVRAGRSGAEPVPGAAGGAPRP